MTYNKIRVLQEHEEAVHPNLCWLLKFSYFLKLQSKFLKLLFIVDGI